MSQFLPRKIKILRCAGWHKKSFQFLYMSELNRARRGSNFKHGCAFSGLENKKLTFIPRNSRNTAIFGPAFGGT